MASWTFASEFVDGVGLSNTIYAKVVDAAEIFNSQIDGFLNLSER